MMSDQGSRDCINRGKSVIEDAGRGWTTCPYCHSKGSSSISHGLWAETLTVDDYQDLLDRGWERSGCYLFKPEMEITCCPPYTIRLRTKDFIRSKEQLRVARRMQRYLDGTWDGKTQEHEGKSANLVSCASVDESSSSLEEPLVMETKQKTKEEELVDYLCEQVYHAIQLLVKRGDIPCDIQFPKGLVKKVPQNKRKWFVQGAEDLQYSSSISFEIAAILRRTESYRKDDSLCGSKKFSSIVVNGTSFDLSPKNIAQEFVSALQRLVRIPFLCIRACNGHINFYSTRKETCSDKEDQLIAPSNKSSIIHQGKAPGVESVNSQKRKRQLEIHMNRSCFDTEEFALFRKYQIRVHNNKPEEVTESFYTRFLIDTPLIFIPPTGDDPVPPCGFGSFHHQYRIDGTLIAVGVIDILPKGLSSKYLFWDPDFAFLSLGKFSALQEIQWVEQNQSLCPMLEYYYLGHYVHSCSKTRYKAAYSPSKLLCPLRYEWVPFDIVKPLLDRKKYVVLSDYANAQNLESSLIEEAREPSDMMHDDLDDVDSSCASAIKDTKKVDSDFELSEGNPYEETIDLNSAPIDIGNILIGCDEGYVRYKDLPVDVASDFRVHLENHLMRYLKVVGPKLSERMVYSV